MIAKCLSGARHPRRSPSLLIVGRLGASALTLISAPIVARALGPEGRGETAAAIALFIIVPVVLGFGLPLEVRRQSATSDGRAVIRAARKITIFSFPAALIIGVLAYLFLFDGFSSDGRVVAAVGVALAPLSTSWALDVSVLVAHRRYGGVLLIQLLQPAVYLFLILLFFSLDIAMVSTVLAASIAGTSATFCVGLWLVRVPMRGQQVNMRDLLRRSFAFSGSAIAEAASNRADQIIALPLIGAYQAGLYSVAATVGSLPFAIGQALGASYFTPIAQATGARRAELQSEAVRAAIAASSMTIPLIAVAAWPALPIIFGEEFAPAVPATMAALLGSAALLTAYVASIALAAEGRGFRMTLGQLISLVCGVSGLFILGPPLGAVGAALASTLGYFTLLTVLLLSLRLPARSLAPRPTEFMQVIQRLKRD